MIDLFLAALALGFLFNAAPGAIFAESLRRGIKGGFWPAFRVQIGSLIGDFVWAVLGLGGAAALFSLPFVEMPLAFFGAGLLAYLAYGSFKDAASPLPEFSPINAKQSSGDYAVGAGLSLSNPINITYWAGLGGTITALGIDDVTGRAFLVFLGGFMTSSVLWCVICAGFIGMTRHMVSQRAWVAINVLCGLGLGYFAVMVVVRTF